MFHYVGFELIGLIPCGDYRKHETLEKYNGEPLGFPPLVTYIALRFGDVVLLP